MIDIRIATKTEGGRIRIHADGEATPYTITKAAETGTYVLEADDAADWFQDLDTANRTEAKEAVRQLVQHATRIAAIAAG